MRDSVSPVMRAATTLPEEDGMRHARVDPYANTVNWEMMSAFAYTLRRAS